MSEVWVINPSVIKHGHEEPGSPLCSRETYWQSCRDAAELGGDGGDSDQRGGQPGTRLSKEGSAGANRLLQDLSPSFPK